MKAGTGAKRRTIKARDVAINAPFAFNKSINPNGGVASSLSISKTKKGLRVIKIAQDLNDDGLISSKEIIYKGRSRDPFASDALLNFDGEIKLTKTMHRCDWLLLKHPNAKIACTLEFIPTVYDLQLADENGEMYRFDAVGEFKALGLV